MSPKSADELYGLEPGEFTKARDELARRLRKEGQGDEADAVKALRKPSVSAWAVNQLARRRPKDVKALLAAGRKLREAQAALLAGGDRAAFQRAAARERELVAKLAGEAIGLAEKAGVSATAALAEKVGATLHAAALDEDTATELAAGRLVREREAVGGFGEGAQQGDATPPPKRAPKKRAGDAAKRRRELAKGRADERRAAVELEAATKAAEQADRHAREAHRRVEHAAKALEAAQRKAQEKSPS